MNFRRSWTFCFFFSNADTLISYGIIILLPFMKHSYMVRVVVVDLVISKLKFTDSIHTGTHINIFSCDTRHVNASIFFFRTLDLCLLAFPRRSFPALARVFTVE